jgi:hypothetical protein
MGASMISQILARLKHANVMAHACARFLALGGTSHAAVTIGTGVLDDSAFVLIRMDFEDARDDADLSLAVLCPSP